MRIIESKFICKNIRFAFVFSDQNEKILIKKEHFNSAFDGDIVKVKIFDENKLLGQVISITKKNDIPYLAKVIYLNKKRAKINLLKSNLDFYINLKPNTNLKKDDLISILIDIKNKKNEIKILKNYGYYLNSTNIMNSIIDENKISISFSSILKNEAMKIKRPNIENELKNRIDLRDKYTITIDGSDAKDLDDAIYLEKTEFGYSLFVSIADVSYFITEASLLDIEAKNRGNSIYLAEKVIPMLPKRISNNLCSLNPNEDKLTFTVKIDYDFNANILSTNFFKSIINSKKRLNYDEVNEMFNTNNNKIPMLFDMLNLSKLIRSKKLKKGMINFNIPEIKLILDENNNILEIKKRISSTAEELIEDFMVEANKVVAEKLFWQEIPAIYRIHETPDIDNLRNLNQKLNLLGFNIPNISEIHPGKIAKIIEDSKNDEKSYLIHKTILKEMKKAKYFNENLGHFALSLPYYLHFTSPIRRYSDLIVHRMLEKSLNETLELKKIESLKNKFKEISEHISSTERLAEKLEKYSVKLKLLDYMKNFKNKEFKARISGFLSNKVFLQLENLVELTYYPNDYNNYIIENNNLISKDGKKYGIGDLLNVKIINSDYEKIEIISVVI